MTGSDDGPLTAAARATVAGLDDATPDAAVAAYSQLHARLVEALDGSAPPAGSGA